MIEKLQKLRERIATLKSDIEDLELGVATRDEAAERLTQWVDHQAEQVSLTQMVATACVNTARIDDDAFSVGSRVTVDGLHADTQMAGLLAWVAGDVLKTRLLEKLDEMAPQHCTTKDAAARKTALTKKQKELDQLELEEEQEICEAERAGYAIARRRDCRPEIVLAVDAA